MIALRLVYNLAESNVKNLSPTLLKSLFDISADKTFRKCLSEYLTEFINNGFPIRNNKTPKILKAKSKINIEKYTEELENKNLNSNQSIMANNYPNTKTEPEIVEVNQNKSKTSWCQKLKSVLTFKKQKNKIQTSSQNLSSISAEKIQ